MTKLLRNLLVPLLGLALGVVAAVVLLPLQWQTPVDRAVFGAAGFLAAVLALLSVRVSDNPQRLSRQQLDFVRVRAIHAEIKGVLLVHFASSELPTQRAILVYQSAQDFLKKLNAASADVSISVRELLIDELFARFGTARRTLAIDFTFHLVARLEGQVGNRLHELSPRQREQAIQILFEAATAAMTFSKQFIASHGRLCDLPACRRLDDQLATTHPRS